MAKNRLPSIIKHSNRSKFHVPFEEPLAVDRLVRKVSNDDVYNCFIWRRNRYLSENWGREIKIERIVDRAHLNYQSVLLARPNTD